MLVVNWLEAMKFRADTPTGSSFILDAYPDEPGTGAGPTPVEALLSALAACTAMDVVLILEKKKQQLTAYRVEIEGERGEPGVYPRPFTSFTIRHVLKGKNLDRAAVERAVTLSEEKYCTVATTLRSSPKIHAEWTIEDE